MDDLKLLHPVICWRYMLCPVTVSFLRQQEKNIFRETVSIVDWKALYLFGVRVAAWRVT